MMEVNPQGWRARRARAQMRQRHGMSREQRAAVREIRRRHAMQASEPEPAPIAEPSVSAPPGPKAPEHMDWKEMAGELRAAGKFVPPRIGEAKLRQRVVDLRTEQGVE